MQKIIEKLNILNQNSQYRKIKDIEAKFSKFITVNGNTMLNLSSNDYLNISTDDNLRHEFVEKYKNHPDFLFSSASARLLTGTLSCYNTLERNIARLFNKEASLLFNTGYQCNQGVISALFDKSDCIFSDKLNHASIVSGLKLSPAAHFRYHHNDMENLEKILKEKRKDYKDAIIISESVFSMDGDIADIKKLIELKKKYNCYLMIDEAHAFCVFGNNLAGVCDSLDVLNDIDIITITLGKALGSLGAVCISKKCIIDYLINKSSPFIFSTAIPSANVMWSNFLLEEKFEFLKSKKEKLNDLFNKVHKIYPSQSASQIIPVIIGEAKETSLFASTMQQQGYYVLPINPPTVPVGTSRLRISLCADMEYEEIKTMFERIKNESSLAK